MLPWRRAVPLQSTAGIYDPQPPAPNAYADQRSISVPLQCADRAVHVEASLDVGCVTVKDANPPGRISDGNLLAGARRCDGRQFIIELQARLRSSRPRIE